MLILLETVNTIPIVVAIQLYNYSYYVSVVYYSLVLCPQVIVLYYSYYSYSNV